MTYKTHDLLRIQAFTTTLDSIDNELLLREIQSTDNEIPTELIDEFGVSTNHTYFEDSTFPWNKPESQKLLYEIANSVSQMTGRQMRVREAWSLTLLNGQSVMSHSHRSNDHMFPQEHYSIAYYANVPQGSASLIFEIGHSNLTESIYVIEPEVGMLVIFNSYLKHMTTRHQSDQPRVVVSANLSPVSPNQTVCPDLSGYKVPGQFSV